MAFRSDENILHIELEITVESYLSDVDFLIIGRVWKGYAFEKDNFLKLQNQEFKFDFNIYDPETILYKHIPWSDESGIKKVFSQYAENIQNSRFTKLTSVL